MPGPREPRDRFVTVGRLRLRYRDWGGDGRPFLALHGAAAHAHWWDPVAPHLAGRLRVLALDWRGHGRSAWPRPPAYRSEDFAADLVGVIERLALRDVVVAGHSMGGHCAMAFAGWHPDRLARLVVLDARPHVNVERLRALQRRAPGPSTEFPSLAAALARFRLRPSETLASPALLRAHRAPGPRAPPVGPLALSLRSGLRAHADAGRLLAAPARDHRADPGGAGRAQHGSSTGTSPSA